MRFIIYSFMSLFSSPHVLPLLVFSFSQGRCSRENCKYLHPPPHLKTQLEINGRNNLIQQKNMAMLAQQMQLANAIMPGSQLQPMVRLDSYNLPPLKSQRDHPQAISIQKDFFFVNNKHNLY